MQRLEGRGMSGCSVRSLIASRPPSLNRSMSGAVLISEKQADYQDTEKATAQTVREMCVLIREAMQDPLVRLVAWEALQSPGSGVPIAKIWQWVKSNVRFESDESQLRRLLGRRDELELLISPSVLLRASDKAGDCDDFTMLLCVMLDSIGVQPLIKTYKCDRDEPWRWSHVCAAAVTSDGTAFPVDASHGTYAGWQVPARDVYESQLWNMDGNKVGGPMKKRGLGGYTAMPTWTGSETTTVSGPESSPYPSRLFLRQYYPGPSRLAGLGAIRRGKYGIGDLADDAAAIASGGGTSYSDAPDYQNAAGDWVNGKTGVVYGGGSSYPGPIGSGGGNSSGYLESLIGQLASSGTRLASQAIGSGATVLPNGNVLLPGGQIVSSTPQSSFGISSNMLLLGGLLLGGVLLVSVMKK